MHLAILHLTPRCTAEQRQEFIDGIDADAQMHERITKPRRFRLKPAGPDGRGG